MKIYYYECEETFIDGVNYQKTSSPITGFKTVIGECSKHSLPLSNVSANQIGFCYSDGSWGTGHEAQCLCNEGYYLSKTIGCLRE
jgi:hypothetical protein